MKTNYMSRRHIAELSVVMPVGRPCIQTPGIYLWWTFLVNTEVGNGDTSSLAD
jgi:hypothetical protein